MDPGEKKRRAGDYAVRFVNPDSTIGLGTGSTVHYFLEALSQKVREGLKVRGIPTSRRTEEEAKRLGIPLTSLDETTTIDLTIDGADEVDWRLNLIKGGGGALLREKVVAAASKMMFVIADETKYVKDLGSTFPVPVEVVPFARRPVAESLAHWGAKAQLRMSDSKPYVTDNGNWILDAKFASIPDPATVELDIKMLPGVVEVGIFTGLCSQVILGSETGVKALGPKV